MGCGNSNSVDVENPVKKVRDEDYMKNRVKKVEESYIVEKESLKKVSSNKENEPLREKVRKGDSSKERLKIGEGDGDFKIPENGVKPTHEEKEVDYKNITAIVFDAVVEKNLDTSQDEDLENEVEYEKEDRATPIKIDIEERETPEKVIEDTPGIFIEGPEEGDDEIRIIFELFREVTDILKEDPVEVERLFTPLEEVIDSLFEINFSCPGFSKFYQWVSVLGGKDSSELINEEVKNNIVEDVGHVRKIFEEKASINQAKGNNRGGRIKANCIFSFNEFLTNLEKNKLNVSEAKGYVRDIMSSMKAIVDLDDDFRSKNREDLIDMKSWIKFLREYDGQVEIPENIKSSLQKDFTEIHENTIRTFEMVDG